MGKKHDEQNSLEETKINFIVRVAAVRAAVRVAAVRVAAVRVAEVRVAEVVIEGREWKTYKFVFVI
tara:strand:- start:988 stop:1185 length:198 start_codon:yes stop_codon:yes gene_type:complete